MMRPVWKTFAIGALISVCAFAVIVWAVGLIVPLIPRLAGTLWFKPVIGGLVVLVFARVHLRKYLHKRTNSKSERNWLFDKK